MHIDEVTELLDTHRKRGWLSVGALQIIEFYMADYDAANVALQSQQVRIEKLEKENHQLRERDEALQSLLLNNAGIRNAFERACNFSFQAPGRYDGAMSSDCKQLFEREHRMLCLLLGREPSNRCDAGGEAK